MSELALQARVGSFSAASGRHQPVAHRQLSSASLPSAGHNRDSELAAVATFSMMLRPAMMRHDAAEHQFSQPRAV
jgi:hypothetical protein